MNNLVMTLQSAKTKTALTDKHLRQLAKIACSYNAELDSCGAPFDNAIYWAFAQLCHTLEEVQDELAVVQRELERVQE